ncbi:MAG: hypothetical protein M3256_14630 [Actinomycetota bacterium]|nr:hypothetical protein [Actinomycetota bacterium]
MKKVCAMALGISDGMTELGRQPWHDPKAAAFAQAIREMLLLSKLVGGEYLYGRAFRTLASPIADGYTRWRRCCPPAHCRSPGFETGCPAWAGMSSRGKHGSSRWRFRSRQERGAMVFYSSHPATCGDQKGAGLLKGAQENFANAPSGSREDHLSGDQVMPVSTQGTSRATPLPEPCCRSSASAPGQPES